MSNDIRVYESFNEGQGMSLTAFCGGSNGGNAIQFTIGDKYCALTEAALEDLILIIKARIQCIPGYSATDTNTNDILFKNEKKFILKEKELS